MCIKIFITCYFLDDQKYPGVIIKKKLNMTKEKKTVVKHLSTVGHSAGHVRQETREEILET